MNKNNEYSTFADASCQNCDWSCGKMGDPKGNLAAGRIHAKETGHIVLMRRIREWYFEE